MGVLRHFPPWDTYWSGRVLGHFRLKNQTRKTDKIHNDIEVFKVFVCHTFLTFPNTYILLKKRIETFPFGNMKRF